MSAVALVALSAAAGAIAASLVTGASVTASGGPKAKGLWKLYDRTLAHARYIDCRSDGPAIGMNRIAIYRRRRVRRSSYGSG